MPRFFDPSAGKTSWALFQGLFILAALLAASATFVAVSGVSPNDPTAGGMIWLLGFNMILIAVLAWIVVRQYLAMRATGTGPGAGRLARRFLLLFGLSAIVPAAIVAIFLGATITRGLDNWFSGRVDTIVEETVDVARETVANYSKTLEEDARRLADDFDETVELSEAPDFLRYSVVFNAFQSAYIVSEQGDALAAAQVSENIGSVPPETEAFLEAKTGEVAQRLYENRGAATALVKLKSIDQGYLYIQKEFDSRQIAQLRRAEKALEDYRAAEGRSDRLQILFAVGYGQIAVLILLLSGRFGLEAAGQITGPIGRLATAAHSVRDGDLTVRVSPPPGRDELSALSLSFNGMTEQLGEQRNALIAAREDAEDRRQFVETLLAEVSAGVVRTDGDLRVTLANRSAARLLDRDVSPGDQLEDVAPSFATYARDAVLNDQPVDASLELERDGETVHFRVKTALDPAGGCVLTFDETTRLVTAQRQLAWRDVARRIAHEIRNPLTPIMLSTERLRRRYAGKIDDSDGVFERCLDTILRQVSDIGRMVEEFSSFARMPKPSVAPFELGVLLEGAGFAQGMVSPDVAVRVSGVEDAPLYLGDERLLGQAFGNLVKNAVQAIEGMPEDAEVRGAVDIDITRTEKHVEIVIEDNGPGFPDEARDKLLEPYVTTKEKGTGLGLAIVNRIIMDHGGSISLQHRSDGLRGARVRVLMPIEGCLEFGGDAAIDADIAKTDRPAPEEVPV